MTLVAPTRLHSLLRLLLIGVVVPAGCSALDHALLSHMTSGSSNSGGMIVLTLAAFIVQVGLLGVLCGYWIDAPLLRWIIYGWCWVLIDVQALTAIALGGHARYWGNAQHMLPSSLFNAQLGLVTIWAVLGTTQWYFRWPAALVLAVLCCPPLLGLHYSGSELSGFFIMQIVVLLVICGVLRWRGFCLAAPAAATSIGPEEPRRLQFGVRHVLIWTTSVAFALGLARALDLFSPDIAASLLGERWLVNITAGGLLAIVLVVALWAALGEGSWLRLVALVCVAPAAGVLVSASQWYHRMHLSSLRRVTPSPWTGMFWQRWLHYEWWLIAWTCLAGGLLFAALLIYRTRGYRLTRFVKRLEAQRWPVL